jgi:threonine dehydrogenase-like Zn-dependent dehydrogenase
MKAVVYQGPFQVAVEEVDDPRIEHPNDVIVKITTSAICGSDLHMYEGRTAAEPGIIFGHENLGIVEEVGPGVTQIKQGDRVVMPFNVACGFCKNCVDGKTGFCLTVNPGFAGGAYGYVAMGPYRGGQAEYLRVPYADFNCLTLPPGTKHEDDFALLADIFPTGYHGCELANVSPGDTVTVYGAGPVGLMSAYSALLRGASMVLVVDRVPERLQKAKETAPPRSTSRRPTRSSRSSSTPTARGPTRASMPSATRRPRPAEDTSNRRSSSTHSSGPCARRDRSERRACTCRPIPVGPTKPRNRGCCRWRWAASSRRACDWAPARRM